MGERKGILPVLEARRRQLQIATCAGKISAFPDVPLSPQDANYRVTPRSQRFQTFDHSALARLTSSHSTKQTVKSAFRLDDPVDSHGNYRSPAVQTKHDILLLLKELRKSSDRPSIKHAKTLCQILETLSRERGYYSEEMTLIVKEMNKVLFCSRDDIPERILQYMYEKDVEVMLQEDNLVPFFYVTDFLYGMVREMGTKEGEMERKSEALTEKYEEKLSDKEREIASLLQQIAELDTAQKPMETTLARMTEENSKLSETLRSYQLRLDRMEEKYRTVKVTLKDDMRLINDLEGKVKMLNNTAMEASKALQSLEGEHQGLLQAYMELRDEYQNCLVRVQQMGKHLEVVEEEKRKTEEQMYHLNVRAAASFEELTPRPSFAKIYEVLSVDPASFSHTEEHITEVSKQIRILQIKANASPRPRATRKQPVAFPPAATEGRNRSPSVDAFAEDAEENQQW